jgi:hypothetical protein
MNISMEFQTFLITALGTLATAIGTMAVWFKGQFQSVAAKLDECEADREELWEALAESGICRRKRKRKDEEDDE